MVLPVCPCVGVVLQSPLARHDARLVADILARMSRRFSWPTPPSLQGLQGRLLRHCNYMPIAYVCRGSDRRRGSRCDWTRACRCEGPSAETRTTSNTCVVRRARRHRTAHSSTRAARSPPQSRGPGTDARSPRTCRPKHARPIGVSQSAMGKMRPAGMRACAGG